MDDFDEFVRYLSAGDPSQTDTTDEFWKVFDDWSTSDSSEDESDKISTSIITHTEPPSYDNSPLPLFSHTSPNPIYQPQHESHSVNVKQFTSNVKQHPEAEYTIKNTQENYPVKASDIRKVKSEQSSDNKASSSVKDRSVTSEDDDVAIISAINIKGNKKSDHELREEFYRKQFRKLTGGKYPPAFFPSRSAHDESFVWRPQVNKEYGIEIPLYRRLDGRLDSENDRGRFRKRTSVASSQPIPIPEYKFSHGDIAYYFRKASWIDYDENGHEIGRFTESFKVGDVVAVLSNGSITHQTDEPDIQFVSVISGTAVEGLSPWVTLPEPPPQPVSDYEVVVLLGMVYVRVYPHRLLGNGTNGFIIVPSGNHDGCGELISRDQAGDMSDRRFSQIIGIPIDSADWPNNHIVRQPDSDPEASDCFILALRNCDIVQPVLGTLQESNLQLQHTQVQHEKKLAQLEAKLNELTLERSHYDYTHFRFETVPVPKLRPRISNSCPTMPKLDENAKEILFVPHKSKESCPLPKLLRESSEFVQMILSSDHGVCLANSRNNSSVLLSNNSWETLENVILFNSVASNREQQTWGVKKRNCFQDSDLVRVQTCQFEHKINSNICEIFVDNRLVMLFFRVANSRRELQVQKLPSVFQQIYLPTAPQLELKRKPIHSLTSNNQFPDAQQTLVSLMTQAHWESVAYFLADQNSPLELLANIPDSHQLMLLETFRTLIGNLYKQLENTYLYLPDFVQKNFFPEPKSSWPIERKILDMVGFYLCFLDMDSLNVNRMKLVAFSLNRKMVLSWKWSSSKNLSALNEYLGWKNGSEYNYPHTPEAYAALCIYFELLQFPPVVRKLAAQIIVPQTIAASLLFDRECDDSVKLRAYSIIYWISKDPFLRGVLLKHTGVQRLLGDFPENVDIRVVANKIRDNLRHLLFAGAYVDKDVSASVPFSAVLPHRTLSGVDKVLDVCLMLTFTTLSLYSLDSSLQFWVRVPLHCSFSKLLGSTPLEKAFLRLDFADSCSTDECVWNVKFAVNGICYEPIRPLPIKTGKDDYWWHVSCSLAKPATEQPTILSEIPPEGICIIFSSQPLSKKAAETQFNVVLRNVHVL